MILLTQTKAINFVFVFFHFNPTIYPCRLHFLSPTPPTLHIPIPPSLPPLPLYREIRYDLRANNERWGIYTSNQVIIGTGISCSFLYYWLSSRHYSFKSITERGKAKYYFWLSKSIALLLVAKKYYRVSCQSSEKQGPSQAVQYTSSALDETCPLLTSK